MLGLRNILIGCESVIIMTHEYYQTKKKFMGKRRII